MQLMNRRLNVIVVVGSITLTSVSTKSLCVTIAKRRVIWPRGVTNVINQGHANHHILRVHTILVLSLLTLRKKLKMVFTQCLLYHLPSKIQFKSLSMLTISHYQWNWIQGHHFRSLVKLYTKTYRQSQNWNLLQLSSLHIQVNQLKCWVP